MSNNVDLIENVEVSSTVNNKNLNNKRQSDFNNDEKDDKDKFKKIKNSYNQQNNINKQSTITKKSNAGCSTLISRKTNLANILINTNLGELQDNQTENILNKIIELNSTIEKNNIEIGTIIDNWVSIIPSLNSKYEGAVMVNFILNKSSKKYSLLEISKNVCFNDLKK